MKLSKILFTTITTFSLITTVNAEEICKKSETSFWNTIDETYNKADQAFMESLDAQVQMSYFKMSLVKLDGSIAEVKKSCNGVASKDILDAYNKKKSKIATQINSL